MTTLTVILWLSGVTLGISIVFGNALERQALRRASLTPVTPRLPNLTVATVTRRKRSPRSTAL